MDNVIRLEFEQQEVRAVDGPDGEPWFVGVDVCRALAIENSRHALSRLDDDEKGVATNDTLGGPQALTIVSEPGVYRLVFTSRKPEAERFKRWLAHEVLPALRRTGRYEVAGRSEAFSVDEIEAMRVSLDLVREARLVFGRPAAQALWAGLPLPQPPQHEGAAELLARWMAEALELDPAGAVPLAVIAQALGARSGRAWSSAAVGRLLRERGHATGVKRLGDETHRSLLGWRFRPAVAAAA